MNIIDPRCFGISTINSISISGGKDSLAQWLRAIENDVPLSLSLLIRAMSILRRWTTWNIWNRGWVRLFM